jgi:hypothetical protein
MSKSLKIQAQIDALIVKLNEAKAEEASQISAAQLTAGVEVTFEYGRAESRTTKQGIVLGVKVPHPDEKKGAVQVKIAVGQGFDAEVVTVYLANIKSIVQAGAPTDTTAA